MNKRLGSLVTLGVLLLLAGCVTMGGDPYTTGQRLFMAGDYHKSLEVLAKTPPHSAYYKEAQSYMQKAAKKICVADFYLRRSIVSHRSGNDIKALAQVKKALKVYPDYKPAMEVKKAIENTLAARKQGKVKKRRHSPPAKTSSSPQKETATSNPAEKESVQSERENYQGSKRLYYRGKRAYDSGDINRAKRIWKVALERYPLPNRFHDMIKKSLTDLLVKEGLEYYGSGRWSKAVSCWEEAVKINPAAEKRVGNYIDRANMNLEAIKELEEAPADNTTSKKRPSQGL